TYVLFKSKEADTVVFVLLLLFILLAVFATGSRTGFVVTVFVVFMSSFLFSKRKQIAVIIFYSSTLFAVFYSVSPELGERLLQLSLEESGGGSGRTRIWVGVLQYFGAGHEYVLGTGFNTFEDVALMAINSARAGHNTYIIIFVELGLIGLFAYCLKVLPLFILAISRSKDIVILTLMLMAPYFIGSLTLGLETRRWFFIFHPLVMVVILEAKCRIKGGCGNRGFLSSRV